MSNQFMQCWERDIVSKLGRSGDRRSIIEKMQEKENARGVYVVQSQKDPRVFKLGAGGTDEYGFGSIYRRLLSHASPEKPQEDEYDILLRWRPLNAIWVRAFFFYPRKRRNDNNYQEYIRLASNTTVKEENRLIEFFKKNLGGELIMGNEVFRFDNLTAEEICMRLDEDFPQPWRGMRGVF